mmetsp:Transcript_63592/g.125773  ORF Transcript_63592/g.125773 Transcript_63592/m.125773 type:complete len:104 (+) Transcript_63592:133-444(+)
MVKVSATSLPTPCSPTHPRFHSYSVSQRTPFTASGSPLQLADCHSQLQDIMGFESLVELTRCLANKDAAVSRPYVLKKGPKAVDLDKHLGTLVMLVDGGEHAE